MEHLTDDAVISELGRRLAERRLSLNLSQSALAHEAGVSRSTVSRLEAGESTQLTNFVRLLRALGLLAELDGIAPPADSPLAALRTTEGRRRASPRRTDEPWTWGDD